MVAIGTVDELRDMIGSVAVDANPDGRTETRYFRGMEDARAYASSLGDAYVSIRRTTLEDVFLELTGEGRGRFE